MSQLAVEGYPVQGTVEKRLAAQVRQYARALASVLIPTLFLFTTEWIHRGTLEGFYTNYLSKRFDSYALAWLLLALVYVAVSRLTGFHNLATLITGLLGNLPAAVTYYKLQMRGEPFLPWDLSQWSEATEVIGKSGLTIQTSMVCTLILLALLLVGTSFLQEPKRLDNRKLWIVRMSMGGGAVLMLFGLIFGVYLQPKATEYFEIVPDMWMQNRYYRNYGVISGFMTNLQTLRIAKPDGYSEEAVADLRAKIASGAASSPPLYENSYAATAAQPEQKPNIIFVMNEAFWDVSELQGVSYSEPVTPNLQRLKGEAAVGKSYSPSFGGGTCDVEFEALTGFSVEPLPMGCKPFQQHVTHDMLSLPTYLKWQGYETMAIHGYYRKYWNRDKAYPFLGINRFIAADDFKNPEKKRSHFWKNGLISDAEMGRRIISEYENRDPLAPLFIHAVTMQNHSSYSDLNYPVDELVDVVQYPESWTDETVLQLRDFATGVKEADELLGTLVNYFSQVEEPTILVFWGDHYNKVGNGYELYTDTGYIASGDTESPNLHGTPLVIWSNYSDAAVDLGTVAAYSISPVVMNLYGLKAPPLFQYLTQQLGVYRARSRGTTVNPDGSFSDDLSELQQQWFDQHWMLQYDLMFGEEYLLKPVEKADSAAS